MAFRVQRPPLPFPLVGKGLLWGCVLVGRMSGGADGAWCGWWGGGEREHWLLTTCEIGKVRTKAL